MDQDIHHLYLNNFLRILDLDFKNKMYSDFPVLVVGGIYTAGQVHNFLGVLIFYV